MARSRFMIEPASHGSREFNGTFVSDDGKLINLPLRRTKTKSPFGGAISVFRFNWGWRQEDLMEDARRRRHGIDTRPLSPESDESLRGIKPAGVGQKRSTSLSVPDISAGLRQQESHIQQESGHDQREKEKESRMRMIQSFVHHHDALAAPSKDSQPVRPPMQDMGNVVDALQRTELYCTQKRMGDSKNADDLVKISGCQDLERLDAASSSSNRGRMKRKLGRWLSMSAATVATLAINHQHDVLAATDETANSHFHGMAGCYGSTMASLLHIPGLKVLPDLSQALDLSLLDGHADDILLVALVAYILGIAGLLSTAPCGRCREGPLLLGILLALGLGKLTDCPLHAAVLDFMPWTVLAVVSVVVFKSPGEDPKQ